MLCEPEAPKLLSLDTVDGLEERQVMELVNNYVNTYTFIPDKVDEWYTLPEFLKRGGGDCEDFAIAKYTMLVALGVSKDNLKMTYGFNIPQKEKHMVLIYTDKNIDESLILDSINKSIVPLNNPDFLAYLFFDDTSMYLVDKTTGGFKRVSGIYHLPKWSEVLQTVLNTNDKEGSLCQTYSRSENLLVTKAYTYTNTIEVSSLKTYGTLTLAY